jgi:hypothetical protein
LCIILLGLEHNHKCKKLVFRNELKDKNHECNKIGLQEMKCINGEVALEDGRCEKRLMFLSICFIVETQNHGYKQLHHTLLCCCSLL